MSFVIDGGSHRDGSGKQSGSALLLVQSRRTRAYLQDLVIDTHRSPVSAFDDKAELLDFELGAQKRTLIYVYESE